MSAAMQEMDDRTFRTLEKATRLIFDELGEHRNIDARDCIRRLVHAYGLEFVHEHVKRVHQVQAKGGLPRPEGGLRTLGGVFFVLVKETVGVEAYRAVTLNRWERLKQRRALTGKKPSPQAPATLTNQPRQDAQRAGHDTP